MFIKIKNYFHSKQKQTIALLLFVAIIHLTRAPDILLHGRLWAEEGSFFYHAWTVSPLKTLFYSYGGYLNLPVNTAILLARWCVPVKYAPYVTTSIGFLFQLLPIFLLLTAKDKWLSSFKIRLLITLLLLFVPETAEISLQSLHIQFHLMLASTIILVLDNHSTHQRWFKLSILLLTTLSGLMTIILIPLYLARYVIDREYLRLEQFITLLIGYIIQFSFFYKPFTERHYHTNILDFFPVFFARDLYIPFLSNSDASQLYLQSLPQHPETLFLTYSITIIVLFLFIFCFYKYPKTRFGIYIFICVLLDLELSIFGAIGPIDWFFKLYLNQRYLFINQSLLCLLLVYLIYTLPRTGKYICIFISVWILITGIYNYYHVTSNVTDVMPWRKQIKLWYHHPNMKIEIWPRWWKIELPPNHQPLNNEKPH